MLKCCTWTPEPCQPDYLSFNVANFHGTRGRPGPESEGEPQKPGHYGELGCLLRYRVLSSFGFRLWERPSVPNRAHWAGLDLCGGVIVHESHVRVSEGTFCRSHHDFLPCCRVSAQSQFEGRAGSRAAGEAYHIGSHAGQSTPDLALSQSCPSLDK